MKTAHIAGLMLVAGAFGALAGGVAGVVSEPETERSDAVLLDRLTEIAKGVDALRDAAAANRDGVADVRERVVAVELEMERRKREPPVIRAESAPANGSITFGHPPVVDGTVEDLDPAVRKQIEADLAARMGDMEAAAKAAAVGAQRRIEKSFKIRAMPEDERWNHAAETLGLNSVQVDELRAAHTALQEAMEAATTTTKSTTGSGGTMVFRQLDGNKIADARKAFGDRVGTLLNDEQKKSWRDEGFESAMGGGRSGASLVRLSGFGRSRDDGGDTEQSAEIEFVGTEAIEIEVDDN